MRCLATKFDASKPFAYRKLLQWLFWTPPKVRIRDRCLVASPKHWWHLRLLPDRPPEPSPQGSNPTLLHVARLLINHF